MRLNKFVFQDKASLILRALLDDPQKEWVVRDFVGEFNVSIGLVSKILGELRSRGFIEGTSRGRDAGARIREQADLIKQWCVFYEMEKNVVQALYSPADEIMNQMKRFFQKRGKTNAYAFTLHSGANLITTYVRDPNTYVYLEPSHFSETALELRQALNLKELKEGGNVFLVNPYYKNSVFWNLQTIKGFPVVSNLQLYLDLFHFTPRGLEQADMLVKRLKGEGKTLA